MTVRTAYRRLGQTAEKWRALAETRRDYFRELHRTGHWKRYYNEEEFVARLREVARICDRWAVIVEQMRPSGDDVASVIETERRTAA